MNMVICLPIEHYYGWHLVLASIVNVAPHIREASFAVHRAVSTSGYIVTNIETGRFVAGGSNIKAAEINARFKCLDKTDADIRKAFRRWKKERGKGAT